MVLDSLTGRDLLTLVLAAGLILCSAAVAVLCVALSKKDKEVRKLEREEDELADMV